ncbi:MAG: sugar porter family MFS transporter [Planctomycetota bacterium]|jgi:sugar porter (SP) family MFS transporter
MAPHPVLIRSSIIAALGGLLFGFDAAVLSGGIGDIKALYELSDAREGFTMASALLATAAGAFLVGRPADVFGRRLMMYVLAVLFLISAIGCAFAWDWYSLLAFRMIGGLGIGGASVIAPMYIAEISPAHLRGRLTALAQFNIVLGILLAYLSNYLISLGNFGDIEWRVMLGVEAVPAMMYLALLGLTPRSPRWLIAKSRDDEARITLQKLGAVDTASLDEEMDSIRESIRSEHHNLNEPFITRRYRVPIMLAVVIAMFNQLSGINAVIYYAPKIFQSAGLGEQASLLSSVGIGFVNLIVTMAAIAVIDKFGRRKLMIVGSIGYILSLSAIAWAFYTQGSITDGERAFSSIGSNTVLIGLIAFIAAHAFGQGAVIWVFLSEIFPTPVRARGQALGTLTHWVMAAAISQTFPMIADRSGGHVFTFYAAMMVLQLVWVLTMMPETKGVPLEKINEKLRIE